MVERIIKKSSKFICLALVGIMIVGFFNSGTKAYASSDNSSLDIAHMSNSEQNELLKYINIEVNKHTEMNNEQKSILKRALIDFFDSRSDSFQEPISLQNTANGESISFRSAGHGLISVDFMAMALNIAIGFVTGGSIASYVRKKGFTALAVALESRLAANLRFKELSVVIKGLSGALMKVADPGKAIAKTLDGVDKIPNNGWIELT